MIQARLNPPKPAQMGGVGHDRTGRRRRQGTHIAGRHSPRDPSANGTSASDQVRENVLATTMCVENREAQRDAPTNTPKIRG